MKSYTATTRLPLKWMMLVLALMVLVLIYATPAKAAQIEVANENDAGPGSLRDAINTANTNGEADTITFDDDVLTITLTSGQLTVTDTDGIEIDGGGFVTVSGNDQSRVFDVAIGGVLTLRNITISDGRSGNESGGGIRNAGTLAIENSTVADNIALGEGNVGGGGISNSEVLSISDSTVSSNQADEGGGVESSGTMTIDSSTISDNTASEDEGGGVFSGTSPISLGDTNPEQRTTITNSTISGNEASSTGGGVYNQIGLTVIENTTITNNTAPDGSGSGVASFGEDDTRTSVYSSIIAGNTNSDVDFVVEDENTFVSNGYNLIGTGNATDAFDETGDQTGVTDPGVGVLADNGGPTATHALLESSPALNAGDPDFTPPPEFDQRGEGFSRVSDSTIDIGSFELQGAAPQATVSPNSRDFPPQRVGTTSEQQSVEVANTGTAPFNITSIMTSGNQFSVASEECTDAPLAAGESCEIFITFSPTSVGEKNATLQIQTDAQADPLTVNLSGEGIAPQPPNPPDSPNACTITGTPGNDILKGTSGRDVICGLGGNDIIYGLGGNDVLKGGAGNDVLRGGSGSDRFVGGPGRDALYGGAGNDTLSGGGGRDTLNGGPGNDALRGGPGNDDLRGGAGNDTLVGGGGDDALYGGPGRDRLIGGPGKNLLRQ